MEDLELVGADVSVPKFSFAGRQFTAKCVKVYDGDTAHFVFRPHDGAALARYICRFSGYNSAEIKGSFEAEKKKALEVRDALREKILHKVVRLTAGDFDMYGRVLVVVELDGENINQWMLDNDYGKPYDGKGAKIW